MSKLPPSIQSTAHRVGEEEEISYYVVIIIITQWSGWLVVHIKRDK